MPKAMHRPLVIVCGDREEAAAHMRFLHREHPARRSRTVTRTLFVSGVKVPVYLVVVHARPNESRVTPALLSTGDSDNGQQEK